MILAFDTETTGLPERLPNEELKEPYITQLSGILYDTHRECVVEYFNTYIQLPPHVKISPKASEISGITDKICKEKGRSITQALRQFYRLYIQANTVIAHNLDFDTARIKCEINRIQAQFSKNVYYGHMFDLDHPKNDQRQFFCTMKHSQHSTNGRWPRLKHLYEHLFGFSVDEKWLHHSFVDSVLCLRIYLKTQKHMTIPDYVFEDWIQLFQTNYSKTNLKRLNPWRPCKKIDFVPI